MRETWARHWPLASALAALGAVVIVVFAACVRADGGRFVYAIDDIYIAMAVARNFAAHGVWGVTPYHFSSNESTIVWPFLLALCDAMGITSELVPLFLNVICGGFTLVVVYEIARKMGLPQSLQAMVLMAVLLLAPLPAMIFSGMEHTLQIGLAILFVYVAARDLAGEQGRSVGASRELWLLAVLVPVVRYEGLFLVFAACLLFMARRRWRVAIGLGLAAAAPPALYGALSAYQGWFWLPNSVYLKANLPHAAGALHHLALLGDWEGWIKSSVVWIPGLSLLILLALRVYSERTVWRKSSVMILLFIVTAALHLRLARIGWFFRYEAYLIALSVVIFAIGGYEYVTGRPQQKRGRGETLVAAGWLGCSLTFLLMLLGFRGIVTLYRIPLATQNIYDQQYQMGLFLRQFYRGQPVAANDIGAVSYLAEPRLLDLWGLASLDVAKLRMAGGLTPGEIDELTKSQGTKVAIVFDRIFYDGNAGHGGLPARWIRVGRWRIPHNYVCGDDTVSFYVVEKSEEQALIAHLQQFAPRLPAGVVQTGRYTQPD